MIIDECYQIDDDDMNIESDDDAMEMQKMHVDLEKSDHQVKVKDYISATSR